MSNIFWDVSDMPPGPDDKRREALLDEIERIMLAEGFLHLRVGALATRLRCSRSTLYKLAPSKTELFVRVFERYADRAIYDADRRASTLDETGQKIVRFAEVVAEHAEAGSDAFWREVRDTPEMAEVLGAGRARGYRALERYLNEGMAAGEVRQMNAGLIAYIAYMASVAIRDPERMAEFGLTVEEGFAELGQLIVKGIAP